jgi:hypothetical protein
MIDQLATVSTNVLSTPDGQERLATKRERDHVNRSITARVSSSRSGRLLVTDPGNSPERRESGDEVNRFLLCTLVNSASRRIKARAERAGDSLPMSAIVRGVLRSYRLAATDKDGPLADAVLDIDALQRLNAKVLGSEMARHDRDRAKGSESKIARTERPGDASRSGRMENDRIADVIELGLRFAKVQS